MPPGRLCSIYGKARYDEGDCLGTAGSGFEGGGVGGDDLNGDSGSLFDKETDMTTRGSRFDASTTYVAGSGHPSEFFLATRAAKDVLAWPSNSDTPLTVDDLALRTQVSTPLVFRAVSYGEYCGSGVSAGVALRTSGFIFGDNGWFGVRRGVVAAGAGFGTVDVVIADVVIRCLGGVVHARRVVGADLFLW